MKSAVVYLTHSKDIDNLNTSINLSRQYLSDRDIVVFYEEGDDISGIEDKNIRFVSIKFSIPPNIQNMDVDNPDHPAKLGYRHMCRFWSGAFFSHPVVQEYDYILRLDSDSYILDKPKEDPIEYCANNRIYYGYLTTMEDDPRFTFGLKDITLRYCSIFNNYNADVLGYRNTFYYTNFEVINVSKVWNPSYEDYFNYLDASGGIYFFRWGDHVIRYLGTKLSIPNRFVGQLKVPYQHQEYICKP